MIKTKYVVGDVVVVNGKQEVVIIVDAISGSLYSYRASYRLSDQQWYDEEEI